MSRIVYSSDRKLWAAVIIQAVVDVDLSPIKITPNSKGKNLQRFADEVEEARADAIMWLADSAISVGSFRWICDMLDLDFHRLQNMSLTREGRKQLRGNDKRFKCEKETESDETDSD